MSNSGKMNGAVAIVTVGLLLAVSPQVQGISMFDANAMIEIDPASVSISSGASVVFLVETGVSNFGPTTTGTGVLTKDVKINDVGFGTQETGAAGSASSPPTSMAVLRNETHDQILVDNFGNSTPALLTFEMTYSASSSVSTTASGDAAFSNYNIHITGIGDEAGESALFSIDGGTTFLPMIRLEDSSTFPAPIGPEFQLDVGQSAFGVGDSNSASNSGTVLVRYTVTPDNDNAFSIFTRAGNAAFTDVTAVPEPTTATLGLIGVAGLLVRRRRRRAA